MTSRMDYIEKWEDALEEAMLITHPFTLHGKSTEDINQCQKCGCAKEQHESIE